MIDDCCDGDRHEIKRDSRGLAGEHATPLVWGQVLEIILIRKLYILCIG